MIPSNRNLPNENLYKQKIKIQLTNDNRCIIKSSTDTPNKSQNNTTINKSELSINYMDYNDNDLMSLSKSVNSTSNNQKTTNNNIENDSSKKNNNKDNNNNNNFDDDGNSNLLISFSNISEFTKINNNDNSIFGVESNKKKSQNKINIEKEKEKENKKEKEKEKDDDVSILSPALCNYYENSNLKENENIDINNKNQSMSFVINLFYYEKCH